MIAPANVPHYLLFTDATDGCETFADVPCGRWCFMLESVGDNHVVEAADVEAEMGHERLELLAVVRGLEALEQPSRVTLVTPSRYVNRGIRFGLEAWRDADWKWEAYGQLSPVKNYDLWQRIDHAMQIHQVECRRWRMDRETSSESAPTSSFLRSSQEEERIVEAVPDLAAVAG